jgi:uncharacterized delta-60 repeat protein
MPLATILRNLRTRLGQQDRCIRQQPTAKPHLERLEDRLALAAFGPEDGAYFLEPWYGHYSDVQIQPNDQKIVAAGNAHGNFRVSVARYDAAGNADTSYGTGGLASPAGGGNSAYTGLALQADGKAIVSSQNGIGWFGAARLNTNGSLDTNFGSGGWSGVNTNGGAAPASVGLQSTGKVVVGGSTIDLSQGIMFRSATVARFKANGATDSGRGGFGQVGPGNKALGYSKTNFGGQLAEFKAIAIQADDKIVAVGDYSLTGSHVGQLVVARYSASGVLDTTFNGSGFSILNLPGISYTSTTFDDSDVALQSNGKIVVVTSCAGIDGASDMLVLRYNTNGSLDTSFGGGSGYVRLDIDGTASQTVEKGNDVAIQPDGKIVVVGEELPWTGVEVPRNVLVARFNTDGTPDLSFASGGFKIGAAPLPVIDSEGVVISSHSFNALGVALQSDGDIIVSGRDFRGSDFFSNPQPLLMRFYGSPPSPLVAANGTASAPADTDPLTLTQVQPLLAEAIARWKATGADVSGLGSLDVRIADLEDATLGLAAGNTITLDVNAAGWGWFVDATPEEDSEFLMPGDQGEQDRMDLLTVLMHELGHLLSHDHDDEGLMAEALSGGTRLTPVDGHDIALMWLLSEDLTPRTRRK